VKEKLRAILSHRTGFRCPRDLPEQPPSLDATNSQPTQIAEGLLPEAIANLKKRADKRPAKLITLRNALAGSLSVSTPEVLDALLQQLQEH
jgi:hypothetical protein